MSEALLTQRAVGRIIGQSRLQRLVRAGWLKPVERNAHSILFDLHDLRAALRRLERGEALPPDRIEVARVRSSEARNGHPRVRKEKPSKSLDLSGIKLDFSMLKVPELYD